MTTTEARAAADAAIERAGAGSGEDWQRVALAAIERIARSQETLTTDDVWEHVEAPSEPRAVGCAMRRAAREGLIRKTGRVKPSRRKECHGRDVAVWRSLVWEGGLGRGKP
jgi:hypothetical protein